MYELGFFMNNDKNTQFIFGSGTIVCTFEVIRSIARLPRFIGVQFKVNF